MQHIILEVKANQRSALILQTKRRVKPCNPGQVKKISEEKAQPLGFFRFGPMMVCLIVRYLFWLLHHK